MRGRFDRLVLSSNLLSGVLWLGVLAPFSGWLLSFLGAVYVTVASAYFAAVYAHDALTLAQETRAWLGPWLVAVALWTLLWVGSYFENSVAHYLFALVGGLVVATACYLAWQITSLAIRQLLAWRCRSTPES